MNAKHSAFRMFWVHLSKPKSKETRARLLRTPGAFLKGLPKANAKARQNAQVDKQTEAVGATPQTTSAAIGRGRRVRWLG